MGRRLGFEPRLKDPQSFVLTRLHQRHRKALLYKVPSKEDHIKQLLAQARN